MALFVLKLWENVFQKIPDISFFDTKNIKKKLLQNFELSFTPRGWLRSASNFGKTRFRWFPTFHFSTSRKKIDVSNDFERPFTPRGWLRSASNFGKTRFRRFCKFDLVSLKNIFEIFRCSQKMPPRKTFSPRKIIFAKSSETRFPKVSRRSELSSGGKRPFKIFKFFVNVQIGCAKCTKCENWQSEVLNF